MRVDNNRLMEIVLQNAPIGSVDHITKDCQMESESVDHFPTWLEIRIGRETKTMDDSARLVNFRNQYEKQSFCTVLPKSSMARVCSVTLLRHAGDNYFTLAVAQLLHEPRELCLF